MSKWYLISSKPDDYGNCTRALINCKQKDLEYVYDYEEIPNEDVEVLKKYFKVESDWEDFDSLTEYLEEYYG